MGGDWLPGFRGLCLTGVSNKVGHGMQLFDRPDVARFC